MSIHVLATKVKEFARRWQIIRVIPSPPLSFRLGSGHTFLLSSQGQHTT